MICSPCTLRGARMRSIFQRKAVPIPAGLFDINIREVKDDPTSGEVPDHQLLKLISLLTEHKLRLENCSFTNQQIFVKAV